MALIATNMKNIEVVIGKNSKTFAYVDDEDFNTLSKTKWYLDSKGYAFSTKRHGYGIRVTKRMHRVIMNAKKGIDIDHINHNTLDNRKENLRPCTHEENQWNRVLNKNNKSGARGISWYKNTNKWRAVITYKNKYINLGLYFNKDDAIKAYSEKAKELFGKFYKCCN